MKKPTPKIEPASFIIKDHASTVYVQSHLIKNLQLAVDQGKPLVVHINQKEEDRSKAQNRLYWMWLAQWSKHQGSDKDIEHLYFKKKFLARIYARDDVGQYRKTFAAVTVLREQNHPMYQQVADGLNELITTTDATVDQFTEYLNDIHAFCNKQGCWLSTPDDLMYAWEMKQ